MKKEVREQLPKKDENDIRLSQECGDSGCRTRYLVDDFYMCAIRRPDCEHAFQFDLSYLCRSPDRHKYSKH